MLALDEASVTGQKGKSRVADASLSDEPELRIDDSADNVLFDEEHERLREERIRANVEREAERVRFRDCKLHLISTV